MLSLNVIIYKPLYTTAETNITRYINYTNKKLLIENHYIKHMKLQNIKNNGMRKV